MSTATTTNGTRTEPNEGTAPSSGNCTGGWETLMLSHLISCPLMRAA